ncbi:adhesin [Pseudomonas sp. N3-W]|uniref:adhesin n=1 Tax=Pseudomonas sp. N3-W TaxID=2975049 RepID=UPI00217E447C|nr:adhesin [Pseudomonas sp. N3-W]UWF46779.1 adhesin [Pseudomonas sp. N3-W]
MKRSLIFIALLASTGAMADSTVPVTDNASIRNSGAQYSGNIGVNQAAGDQSQQTNARVIAIGKNASASTRVNQNINTPANSRMNATASISGNAFSNGSGVLGVNQSAGANNQMANVMRISVSTGPQSIDDSVLSQQNVTPSTSSGATDASNGSRQVTTSDQAFTGSRGVIQVNQSAGVGNQIANTLSIRVAN